MNIKKKIKNPYFWIGLGALFFSSTGIEPADMTSWSIVGEKIMMVLQNPFLLSTFGLSVFGQIMNYGTKGIRD